jgi:hypothetical protein
MSRCSRIFVEITVYAAYIWDSESLNSVELKITASARRSELVQENMPHAV